MQKLLIKGGTPLKGKVKISGSKNATLPILAATLLTEGKCVLENVPEIDDVFSLLNILKELGSKYEFKNNKLTIQTPKIKKKKIENDLIKQMRASILLLGPILAKKKEIKIDYPGGCVLGKRSVSAHLFALEKLAF